MASTNFLVFDEGKQNMMSDGDYSANTQRARGVTPGIAYPNLHNKLYYQVSVMAKAIADFMVAQGVNASDEDVEQLTDDISTAFTNFVNNKTEEKYLPLSGGTMKGNINASGHNITATKFIGNLQGNADSADKLGTSTVGSATKPVYINNGVASAVSVDLSTLAPKASPGLTGTPTAPTPDTDDDSTKIATTAFIQNLLASKFTSLKEENGWEISSDGVITMWGTGTITSNNTGHTGSVKAILPITISKMLICVGNMGTTVNNGVGSIMEVRLSSDGSYITGAWDSFSYNNNPTKWRYLLKGVV